MMKMITNKILRVKIGTGIMKDNDENNKNN